MTYAQGSLIQATDYYTLAAAGGTFSGPYVGQHWGVGSGDHGMGQNMSAIQNPPNNVSINNVVTAVQWTGLIQTINSCLSHQGSTTITPTNVVYMTPIKYFASITNGSALAYTNAGTTGLTLSDGVAHTNSYINAWGTSGNRKLLSTHTVTFASGDSARYFFNAGGKVKITTARTGGSNTIRNADWTALCVACGSIQLGYKNTVKVGGSGSVSIIKNANNGGYWNLGISADVHFKQLSGSGSVGYGYYSADYIDIIYWWSGVDSNGGKPTLNIQVRFANASVQPSQDTVDGTTSSSVVISSPATTFISNTWGTPSITGSIVPS